MKSTALSIGDKFTGKVIKNVMNHPAQTIDLKKYKGKLLLIHFLATTCSSCIEFTEKYDSLFAGFNDSVEVLIVTSETNERVKKFLDRRPGFFKSRPVVVHDKELIKQFPYEFISHMVWINPAGNVAALTGTQYVTRKNIRTVLNGEIPSWPVKRDINDFDTGVPFLKINDSHIESNSLPSSYYYAAFYRHLPNLPVGIYKKDDTAAKIIKTVIINQTISELYLRIYGENLLPYSHVLFNVDNPEQYYYNEKKYFKAGWDLYNTYCYEAILPASFNQHQQTEKMLTDVGLYLGTSATLKDTTVSGLILRSSGNGMIPFKSSRPEEPGWMEVKTLIVHLNDAYLAPPAISEVPHLDDQYLRCTIELLRDLPLLKERLAQFGLVLENKPVKIRALVIKQERPFPFSNSTKLYLK